MEIAYFKTLPNSWFVQIDSNQTIIVTWYDLNLE